MELHQLRYFVAVARTGSFTRAAESCFVSQPSLSQQLKKLEEELGESLVHRMRQQATLTESGKRFLKRASRILREVEEARRDAESHRNLIRGEVRIGVIPTAAPFMIPPALREFAREFPGVRGTVVEEPTVKLRELLTHCELDLAVVSLPIEGASWHVEPLLEEELLLATPPGHRLARQEKVALDDLRDEQFVLMKPTHTITRRIVEATTRAGFQPKTAFRTSQLITVESLVGAGMGISLFPALSGESRSRPRVRFRRLEAPAPTRQIAAVWHKSSRPSKAAQRFLEKLRDTVATCLSVVDGVRSLDSKPQPAAQA